MLYNKAKKDALERLKKVEAKNNNVADSIDCLETDLLESRKSAARAIERIEKYVNALANSPVEFRKTIAETKQNIQKFDDASAIERENINNNVKGGSGALGGILLGGGGMALGGKMALKLAKKLGKDGHGKPIANLHGAVQDRAAWANLGGGPKAMGGGGIAGGKARVEKGGKAAAVAAGVMIVGSAAYVVYENWKAAKTANGKAEKGEKMYVKRTTLKAKLNELYKATEKLRKGLDISDMVNLYPSDYLLFNEEQKERLAAVINNARSMGEIINKKVS